MDVLQVASSQVSATSYSRVVGVSYAQTPPEVSPFLASPQTNTSDTADVREAPSERLAQAVRQVNGSFSQKGQDLYATFEKDKATGINIIKFMDKRTNEIISQVPPKEIVKLAQFIEYSQEMRGQLIHNTA